MKFTLSWLKKHLETEATLDEILYALTDLGLEVEEVSNPADKLKSFTLAKVQSAEQASRCGSSARVPSGNQRGSASRSSVAHPTRARGSPWFCASPAITCPALM